MDKIILQPYGPFLEEWKFIHGTNNLYKISNYGRVISYVIYKEGSYLKLSSSLYLQTHLLGINKIMYIHRLVALHFVENKEKKPNVNHLDGCKTNNCFMNFKWSTYSENNKHAYLIGLKKPQSWLSLKGKEHKFAKPVIQLGLTRIKIAEYESICQASAKTGITEKSIRYSLNGKISRNAEFIWTYAKK